MIILLLSAVYMIAEVVGGYLTNSLALLADAAHMFSDVAALGLSLFAIRIAARPPNAERSYGYHRTEILAALANGAALVAISIYICVEAYGRLWHPPDVAGPLMMAIAVGGLVVNVLGLLVLHGGKQDNLNIRGAWLHMATDALGSVGVIVGAALIWAFGWHWADPVVSVLISVLVIYSAWSLIRESVNILMESTPTHLDANTVRAAIAGIPGVSDVHDLHIWSITSNMHSVSTHVVVTPDAHNRVLADVRTMLHNRFGIDHSTVQCEPPGFEEPVTHA
jgi:cobalt-zinc-cadmium efflux system protein